MKRVIQAIGALAIVLACAGSASAQVSFDIQIGHPPPPPRAYRVPRAPGVDYMWVDGYWYPVRGRWTWHNGYWTRPPYNGAYWVAPYYYDGRYFPGQWEGGRGALQHDHRWDRSRGRDERRDNDRRRGRDHRDRDGYRDNRDRGRR